VSNACKSHLSTGDKDKLHVVEKPVTGKIVCFQCLLQENERMLGMLDEQRIE
jgi:hypothetical protein